MLRTPRIITLVILVILATALSAGTTLASGACADNPQEAAQFWNGDPGDWHKIPNTLGTGWAFNSQNDERVRAPRVGTLTVDRRQYLWSTSRVTRFIWIDHGTIWCGDKRGADDNRPLSGIVRSRAIAATKYKAGSASNYTRVEHSQSRGWVFNSSTPTQLWVFHGHVDHAFGTTQAGNWTPEVTEATGWY